MDHVLTFLFREINIVLPPEIVHIITNLLDNIDGTVLYYVSKTIRTVITNNNIVPINKHIVCETFARTGNINLLNWVISAGYSWDIAACYTAAQCGHLHVLQWALTRDLVWTSNHNHRRHVEEYEYDMAIIKSSAF